MRALVVTVVHHPSDARILHRQVRSLLDAGHQVTYIAPWVATGTVPPDGLEAVDVPRARGRARGAAVAAARRRIRALSPGADIVLVHDPELLLAALGTTRVPVVWDVHEDTAAALGDKPWLPAVLRGPVAAGVHAVERVAERRVHLLLAEERYAPRFRDAHPVVPNETVVPETVEPSGADRVVYLGRLSRGRGAEELLAVSEALPPGVVMELTGPADTDVEGALRAAHRDGQLVWHPFVPNDLAVSRLEGALAGLSLLRDEPNYRHSRPTKVVEYMARGVPVITTPNPLAAAMVERHRCGVVVPFRDPAAASAAVLDLWQRRDERQALGRRGHEAARSTYDWSDTGRRFVAQLERWAEEPRRWQTDNRGPG